MNRYDGLPLWVKAIGVPVAMLRSRATRKHSKMRLAFVALTLVVSTASMAQNPSRLAIFNSDETLKEAQNNISDMDANEIRLFADFLAQCTNSLSEEKLIQNACDTAHARYDIEYGSDRPLDRLLWSIRLVEYALRNKIKIEDGAVSRLVDVVKALKSTTNRIFYLVHKGSRK
jgi:hypothetical protein